MGTLPLTLLVFAVAAVAEPPTPPPPPSNMKELECAVHDLALSYSGKLGVPGDRKAVYDALRLSQCGGLSEGQRRVLDASYPARKSDGVLRLSEAAAAAPSFYVSTSGEDSNPGTLDRPFLTLTRAQRAVRDLGPSRQHAFIFLREGTYYLNDTLRLSKADNHLTIASYKGERAVISGGKPLKSVEWKCSSLLPDCKVFETKVTLPKAPRVTSKHPSGHVWGLPPEIVNQLFVNGSRMIRARYPNANPQTTDGHCYSKPQFANEKCDGWLAAQGGIGKQPEGTIHATISYDINRGKSPTKGCPQCTLCGTYDSIIYIPPEGHPVYNKPLPGVGWTNNSVFSPFPSPFSRPADFVTQDLPRKWSSPHTGIVHMFHPLLWGSWMYRMTGRNGTSIDLGYGGYQEGRGAGMKTNHHYFENIKEELDSPGEWFYDEDLDTLYLFPNGTVSAATLAASEVVVPLLSRTVEIMGTPDDAVQSITIAGVDFTQTRATFMEQYEVPSRGDWSIHRDAALFVQDAQSIAVTGCTFNMTGGNAIMFSNMVTDSTIEENEFVYTGDSMVAFVGRTDGIDGSRPTYPNRNRVVRNHMHEYGVYGKQTSCFFQTLSANTTFEENVCYNGPRAGVNFNDGFGGNNLMTHNLLFNHVRETGDHGPFNSWDRQPYFTRNGVDDGFPDSAKMGLQGVSIIKAQCRIENNFFINGYNGVWTIDHDDGSQFYTDTENVMVWGGCKNFLGNSKTCDHNLILYPGIDARAEGSRRCQTDDNGMFSNQYFFNNTCITQDGVPYTFAKCTFDNLPETVYITYNNTFRAPENRFDVWCDQDLGFDRWQSLNQDKGSHVEAVPSVEEISAMVKGKLGM